MIIHGRQDGRQPLPAPDCTEPQASRTGSAAAAAGRGTTPARGGGTGGTAVGTTSTLPRANSVSRGGRGDATLATSSSSSSSPAAAAAPLRPGGGGGRTSLRPYALVNRTPTAAVGSGTRGAAAGSGTAAVRIAAAAAAASSRSAAPPPTAPVPATPPQTPPAAATNLMAPEAPAQPPPPRGESSQWNVCREVAPIRPLRTIDCFAPFCSCRSLSPIITHYPLSSLIIPHHHSLSPVITDFQLTISYRRPAAAHVSTQALLHPSRPRSLHRLPSQEYLPTAPPWRPCKCVQVWSVKYEVWITCMTVNGTPTTSTHPIHLSMYRVAYIGLMSMTTDSLGEDPASMTS